MNSEIDIPDDDLIPEDAFTAPAPKPVGVAAPRGGNAPTGPECPDCGPRVHCWENKTKTGKPYFRCSHCKTAWWPDDKRPGALGKKWPPLGAKP